MARSVKTLTLTLALLLVASAGAPASAADGTVELLEGADLALRSLNADQQHYLDKAVATPTVERSRLVRFAARSIETVERASLTLFPGETVTVEKLRVEKRGEGDYTWIGTVPKQATQVILVVNGEHVTGSVVEGDRRYRIRPLGGGLSVVTLLNPDAFPPDHPEGAYEALEAEAEPRFPLPPAGIATRAAASCTYVDLVVAYTTDARASVADIYGLAQLAVAETNQSYANSSIAHQVRLVHFYGTGYSDSGSLSTDLGRLQSTSDGNIDEIHNLRNAFDGDVGLLITDSAGSACGIAAAIYASSSSAFAVVTQNCATGYYSFGHEIGHLHGARHNTQADPSTTPFAYGHGYYYAPGHWRTVMSYNCPGGCTRIPYWSNPYVTYGGVAMGTVSTNDNHRVLNETCSYVAGFK